MEVKNTSYGYCRCSTNDTKQDVEYQIKELMEKGVEKANIRVEYESGAKEDRTIFNQLLQDMKKMY